MGKLASMTGVAEVRGELSPRLSARVKVWSVNARGLEAAVRITPRGDYPELELALRRAVGEKLARGRVTVAVELSFASSEGYFQLHWEVAQTLAAQLAAKPAELPLAPLSFGELASLPGFLEVAAGELAEEEREKLLTLVLEALEQLRQAREQEAAYLLPAIQQDLAQLADFVAFLGAEGAKVRQVLLERLRQRMAELVGEGVDEARLLQEVAFAAEKADVAEEKNRLAAHLALFRKLLAKGGAVGRKLDFLVQEMLREVNTAGSKLREAGVGEQVVEAKAALERLREQIANLE